MKKHKYQGVFADLVTPFESDGRLDEASLTRLVEHYLAGGVAALVVLSEAGEGSRLLESERQRVTDRVIELADDRVPVIVDATADGSEVAAEYARRAEEAGAAALLVAAPLMLWPDDEAFVEHYRTVARASRAPQIVMNAAGRPTLSARVLLKLATQIDTVRAVAYQSMPSREAVIETWAVVGDQLQILGGLGRALDPAELTYLGNGAIIGFSQPDVIVELLAQLAAGDLIEARALYERWMPLMLYECQARVRTAVRKEVLYQQGVLRSAAVRAPTPRIGAATYGRLDAVLGTLLGRTDHLALAVAV